MFLSYRKDLKLTKSSLSLKRAVESLRYLTFGYFAAVTRQNRFSPNYVKATMLFTGFDKNIVANNLF